VKRSGKAPEASAPKPTGSNARHAAHEVRIIGGQWRRSLLPVADRPGLRPTPNRVRETLFNWLGQDLQGWRVVDVFAGSGALGFEAASRGAETVVLLEQDPVLVHSLEATRVKLKAPVGLRVQRADGLGWLRGAPRASFELVLLDPPFDSTLAEPALAAAARVVVPGGFIYFESPAPLVADPGASWKIYRQSKAGAVHFALLQSVLPAEAASVGAFPP
jgi:16S rRNA (guanine(966)-N(2))-methyltransferase RsmD